MKVAKIFKLPPIVRREIEERLAANGFSDYEGLKADLRRRGWNIGKSSLHRWGVKLKHLQEAADIEAAKARAKSRARKAAP
jgi:hypothetical protein